MPMDFTDLTIHEAEDEDLYVNVEKNLEITKHGNCQHIPVSSFCFLLYCPVFCLVIMTIILSREHRSMAINRGAP